MAPTPKLQKRKKEVTSLADKLKILDLQERCEKVTDVAKKFNVTIFFLTRGQLLYSIL